MRLIISALVSIAFTAPASAVPSSCALLLCSGASPSFYQDFTSISTLPGSAFSYSGWTTGQRYCENASGILALTAAPCLDYAPFPVTPLGLRVEGSRSNVLPQSGNLANAAWTALNSTLTTSGVSPDNTADATLVTDNVTNVGHGLYPTSAPTSGAGLTYTESVFFKAGTLSFGAINAVGDSGNYVVAVFNLATGISTYHSAATSAYVGSGCVAYGNSWYRCFVSFTTPTSVTIGGTIDTANAATPGSLDSFGNPVYSGSGQTLSVWGAQIEAGAFMSSQMPTTTPPTTPAADAPALSGSSASAAAKGPSILETQSEQTGAISRTCYAAGAFAFPSFYWIRKLAIYQPSQTCAGLTAAGYLNINKRLH